MIRVAISCGISIVLGSLSFALFTWSIYSFRQSLQIMVGSAHPTNLLVLLEAGAQWISIALLNQSVAHPTRVQCRVKARRRARRFPRLDNKHSVPIAGD